MTTLQDGTLRVEGRSNSIDGQYTLEVSNAYGTESKPIYIRWKQTQEYGKLNSIINCTTLFDFSRK